MVGLMATSSKRTYAISTPRAPDPVADHCRCVPPQEVLRQFCLSLCGVPGSWCTQALCEPSELLWRKSGLILNANLPLLQSCWGFSFLLTAASVPTGVFLTLAVGYLHLAGPAKLSLCCWTWGSGTWYVPAIYFWHE